MVFLYNWDNPELMYDVEIANVIRHFNLIASAVFAIILLVNNNDRVRLWKQFKKNHTLQEYQTWKVSKESIVLMTENLILVNKIADIHKFVETDAGFVWCGYGYSDMTVTLPKSAFESEEQYQDFQTMIPSPISIV